MWGYGSVWVHAALLPFTFGVGNVLYGYYSFKKNSQPSNNLEAPSDGDEEPDNVVRASGVDGEIAVDDTKVVISRSGGIAFVNHGLAGDKEIWLNSINGIQFKGAGATTGHIQINQSGYDEDDGGKISAVSDENTVQFRSVDEADFKQVKQAIEQRANQ